MQTAGYNSFGQLGDGSKMDRGSFIEVIPSRVKAVAAGASHSMVLKQDGSVWATGRNANGELGDGSEIHRNSFVKVISGGVKSVAAGETHSMVLKEDGSVWSTGLNSHGQLGDTTGLKANSAWSRTSFVQVVPTGAKSIAASTYYSMLLKQDGSVWATGWNYFGQFGVRATDTRDKSSKVQRRWKEISDNIKYGFVKVAPSGVKAIATGYGHSVLVKQGSVWSAGSNKFGQLGDGTTTTDSTEKFVKVGQHLSLSLQGYLFRLLGRRRCQWQNFRRVDFYQGSSGH